CMSRTARRCDSIRSSTRPLPRCPRLWRSQYSDKRRLSRNVYRCHVSRAHEKEIKKLLKKLFYSAGIYAALGLAGGLYYRTLTHAQDFTGHTQLGIVHTHLLVLGMIFMLLLLALEKTFTLSKQRSFNVFFWLYNIGLVITVGMQTTFGTMTVLDGAKPESPMMNGISGLGHMFLTAALIALFIAIGGRLNSDKNPVAKRLEDELVASD